MQIWKHVKFSTDLVFLFNDQFPIEPDRCTGRIGRYTGGNRLSCVFWFGFWIQPVFSDSWFNRFSLPEPDAGGSAPPVEKKNPGRGRRNALVDAGGELHVVGSAGHYHPYRP
jgi:hypothetical protein